MNNTKQFKIQNNSKLNRSAESKRKEIGCPLCVFKFCMKTTGWPFSIIMRGKSNHHQVSPHTTQKANQPRSTKNTCGEGMEERDGSFAIFAKEEVPFKNKSTPTNKAAITLLGLYVKK